MIEGLTVPEDVMKRATVHSAAECEERCQTIGFPVMIKASEGGGGKGIRKADCVADARMGYEACEAE
eukprot:scaffold4655_cov161-Prasinococcus_capsulatus_cf.AAC.1